MVSTRWRIRVRCREIRVSMSGILNQLRSLSLGQLRREPELDRPAGELRMRLKPGCLPRSLFNVLANWFSGLDRTLRALLGGPFRSPSRGSACTPSNTRDYFKVTPAPRKPGDGLARAPVVVHRLLRLTAFLGSPSLYLWTSSGASLRLFYGWHGCWSAPVRRGPLQVPFMTEKSSETRPIVYLSESTRPKSISSRSILRRGDMCPAFFTFHCC